MKIFLTYIFGFLFFSFGFAQQIQVSQNQFDAAGLVDLLLGNSCTEVSNISLSSPLSVAYFNKNNSNFPIQEGIIIRNGNALFSAGPYTNQNLSSQINQNTDPFLQFLSNQNGQNNLVTDVAFLQFDFVPLSNSFSFDFLFASNEYGEFQCGFSDVFAFILEDLNTGAVQNLAVVPNTSFPISVLTIRDQQFNLGCTSANPQFFSTYNVTNPANSSLNMRGHTTVMTASSAVLPNNPYRIRLVIGDVIDSNFDSAVFIAAGNFGSDVDLGEDRSICNGDQIVLNTGFSETEYTFTWTKNGQVLQGENTPQLTIDGVGTYAVQIEHVNSNCVLTGSVTFTPLPAYLPPQNLSICVTGATQGVFDLTQNNIENLEIDTDTYVIRYFASVDDFTNNIPIANPTAYLGQNGQIIIFTLFNPATNSYCTNTQSFLLTVFSDITFDPLPPLNICFNERSGIDLTVQNVLLLQGLPLGTNYIIQYFNAPPQPGSNAGEILNPASYTSFTETQETIWVRVTNEINADCFGVTSFTINILNIPDVDTLEDVIVCSFYELPVLVNGNYFTQSNGAGTPLFAGDLIEETGTYYIFSGLDENGCSNETNFTVTVAEDYSFDTTRCGAITLLPPSYGLFYAEPNAQGNPIPSGTVINSNTTVYFYAIVDDVFCTEIPFELTILPIPPVDQLPNVVVCNSYILPPLTNGSYYSLANGLGSVIPPGSAIINSRTVFIYAEDENGCSSQTNFFVNILPVFNDIVQCGPYVLPSPSIGGFFTQPNGGGTQIPNGTLITESTTLYYFAQTTSQPNCTENYPIQIIINTVPSVDTLDDVLLCFGETYTLPQLTQGIYYTQPDGQGIMLFEGFVVSSTQTIYVYNMQSTIVNDITYICSNQSSFVVEIRPLPPVASFTDVTVCASYILPNIPHGQFYTEPNGQGTLLPFGTAISTTQTIYIFNEYADLPGCSSQTVFQVESLGVDIPSFGTINACGSYTLPPLAKGNYYTQPNAQGNLIPPGTVITTSQIVYAYVFEGDRLFCEDEEILNITIGTPIALPNFQPVQACESYLLPPLPVGNYTANYYFSSGGNDLISPSDYTLSPGTYTIYVYAVSNENSVCTDEKQFQVTVFPRRVLNYPDQFICVTFDTQGIIEPIVLQSGLSANQYSVAWYLNNTLVGTGSTLTVSEAGVYTLIPEAVQTPTPPLCAYEPATISVFFSSSAVAQAIVSQDFTLNNTVEVQIIAGLGNYSFQLDNGNFQSNPIFQNVSAGLHFITVRDNNGNCDDVIIEVVVLNYPKFFTPNGDGENDVWHINDLFFIKDAYINIYDRYGKLITRLKHNEPGWDGNYNGRPLPSSDYWFQVIYQRNGEPREFRAHFSLKR